MKKAITVYVLQLVCYPYGSREFFCAVKNHDEAVKLCNKLTDASKEHYCSILNTKKLSFNAVERYVCETDLFRDSDFKEMTWAAAKKLFD